MRRVQRQKYERPAMRVVEMRVKNQLLAGSGGVGASGSINDWGDGGTTDDDIYM